VIVPVPEQTLVVEQSVTNVWVEVPEMMLVPLQLVTGVAEQLAELDVCCDDDGLPEDIEDCGSSGSSGSSGSCGSPSPGGVVPGGAE
jgi:hypothetical protein